MLSGLVITELVLWVTGTILRPSLVGEQAVRSPIPIAGKHRILCLGESTTRGVGDNSWPKLLSDRLENYSPGRYEVINHGIPAVYSKAFSESIDRRLDLVRPSLVITMIGINDDYNLLVYRRPNERAAFMDYFRVTKLFRLLFRAALGISSGVTSSDVRKSPDIERILQAPVGEILPAHKSGEAQRDLLPIPEPSVAGYSSANSWTEQVKVLEAALKSAPDNISILARLDDLYSAIGDGDSVIPILRQMAMLNFPQRSASSAFRLAEILRDDRLDYIEATSMFRRTLALEPNHVPALTSLAQLLRDTPDGLREARRLLERAASLEPPTHIVPILLRDVLVSLGDSPAAEHAIQVGEQKLLRSMRLRQNGRSSCAEMVGFYRVIGMTQKELETLRECVELWPSDEQLLRNLGDWYFTTDAYSQAIEIFKRVAAHPNTRERLKTQTDLEAFAVSLMLESKRPGAVQRFLALSDWALPEVNAYTRKHYLTIAQAIRSRGITHIAVQYPTLSVLTLQRTLAGEIGIEFVDNEQTFADALRTHSFDELFVDRFAGSFGHMTPLGHDILAENIERVVVQVLP